MKAEGKYGKPRLSSDNISELQIIVKDDTDNEIAWPIIGELGRGKFALKSAAGEIARKMNLPLITLTDKATGIGSFVLDSREYKRE